MLKIKKIIILIAALPLIVVILIVIPDPVRNISDYLSKNLYIKADALIVEGWLPDFALKGVVEEINKNPYKLIITTGIKSPELDYCLIGMDGYLIFYPKLNSSEQTDKTNHQIGIIAKSKMGGKYSCHFNIFLNDSIVAEFTADEISKEYSINWKGSLSSLDSIMVNFDNDFVDENGDRNFYVREIIIDGKYRIPYQYNSVYDIGKIDSKDRIRNDYSTVAEFARNRLIRLGVDSSRIVSFSSECRECNRTLSSAKACRDGLKKIKSEIKSANVITLGIHARRTWKTYNTILEREVKVGIISIPLKEEEIDEEMDSQKVMKEIIALIYYNFLLLPFIFL